MRNVLIFTLAFTIAGGAAGYMQTYNYNPIIGAALLVGSISFVTGYLIYLMLRDLRR